MRGRLRKIRAHLAEIESGITRLELHALESGYADTVRPIVRTFRRNVRQLRQQVAELDSH